MLEINVNNFVQKTVNGDEIVNTVKKQINAFFEQIIEEINPRLLTEGYFEDYVEVPRIFEPYLREYIEKLWERNLYTEFFPEGKEVNGFHLFIAPYSLMTKEN